MIEMSFGIAVLKFRLSIRIVFGIGNLFFKCDGRSVGHTTTRDVDAGSTLVVGLGSGMIDKDLSQIGRRIVNVRATNDWNLFKFGHHRNHCLR